MKPKHIQVKEKRKRESKYMSILGTLFVVGFSFLIGLLIGYFVGSA